MIIGLTGSIGSGKSTVSQFFRELDVLVIDSDQITRKLVAPGQPALKKIIEHFGNRILNKDGSLNRTKLRTIIFGSATSRQWLEALLHPAVKIEILKQTAKCPTGQYIVVEIPLLIEANFEAVVDRILVVDCPETLQIERVSLRDALDKTHIQAILSTQSNRATRLQKAHDVILNDDSKEALKHKVIHLHHYYLELASHNLI